MTFTQITYFEAVCQYKNVSTAAKALFVSRSAVSRALKELENEWNLVLFTRSHTGVELTEDGERLRNMFREFNIAYNTLKASKNNSSRTIECFELRIGITTTTGSRFFPKFFTEFSQKHPNIQLRIIEHSSHECLNILSNNECDFFITPYINKEFRQCESLEIKHLYDGQWILCTSKDHKFAQKDTVTLKEAAQVNRASFLIPMNIDILEDRFLSSKMDFELDPHIVMQSSQHELIRKAVSCGFTTMILPLEIAESWSDVQIIPFNPTQTIHTYLVWNKNVVHNTAHSCFLEYVNNFDFSEFNH